MAGRTPYTPSAVASWSRYLSLGLPLKVDGGIWAYLAATKHALAKCRATTNRIHWRALAATRASNLSRIWRSLAKQLRSVTWRREKGAPGAWLVLVLDAAGTWVEVARVVAPPLRGMSSDPSVAVVPLAGALMENGLELRIALA